MSDLVPAATRRDFLRAQRWWEDGFEASHLGQAFGRHMIDISCAARIGDLDRIRWLIKHEGANPKTVLLQSASYGHLPVVQYIIEHELSSISEADSEGSTPLLRAAEYGK
jgi:hypothetical protein